MKPLQEITKELADARQLERATGLLNPSNETHHVFFVYERDNEARAEEVANNGDVYDALKSLMVRVMVGKVRDIDKVRAVIVEAHASARKVPKEYQNTDPTTLPQEVIEQWETQDVVVTIGHDGETVTNHTRGTTDNEPNFDEVGDTSSAQGRLAEAVETLTLGVLLAGKFKETDEN